MLNYFDLFHLPVSFLPPKDLVRKNYVELSKQHHPDYFAQSDNATQSNALELSSEVNKAFKIFNSQQQTIKYVLELKGLLEDEEKYVLSPLFLMEMMEINEKIADIGLSAPPNEAQAISEQLSNIENEIYEGVADVIENYKEDVTTNEDLLKVKEYYFKKKYLARIYEALNGKL